MRFKLDENLDLRLAVELASAGHSVSSVLSENFGGAKDSLVWDTCQAEGLCLITLDKGFGNIVAYPPRGTSGVIVLRPERQVLGIIQRLFAELAIYCLTASPADSVWVVETGRIRVCRPS